MNDYDQGWMNGFIAGSKRGAGIAVDMIRVNGFTPQQVEEALRQHFESGRASKDMQKEMKLAISEKRSKARKPVCPR